MDFCPNSAIELIENNEKTGSDLTNLIKEHVTAIEIHTGNSNVQEVKKLLEELKKITGEDYLSGILLSYSVESSRYNKQEFIEYTNELIKQTDEKVIIQVDGRPMSGSSEAGSSLQSLAAGQLLGGSSVDAYVILAGGINHLTEKYVKIFGIDCNGIAMGTYARKLLWPYLYALDKREIFTKARKITTILVRGLEF